MADSLYNSGEKMARSEFDGREFSGQLAYHHQSYAHSLAAGYNGIAAAEGPPVMYRPKRYSRSIFRRKPRELFSGGQDR